MKTSGAAYVLLLLLGSLGAHKFYLNKTGMGILYLSLAILGSISWVILLGWIFHIPLIVLWIIDLFTLPRQVRTANEQAAVEVARFQKMVEKANN